MPRPYNSSTMTVNSFHKNNDELANSHSTSMTDNKVFNFPLSGVLIVVFAILYFATQANELLRQVVIAPGSVAEQISEADCRADELVEENLSLAECQLMVSSVQITLASSPSWFRSFQISSATLACIAAMLSFLIGFKLIGSATLSAKLARFSFSSLALIDILQFLAVLNTGPLLRAQYLWPLLIWLAIHISFLIIFLALNSSGGHEKEMT